MKKLLLLLLLPVCLLAQEEKPRKLFFEIKQGVGLPSVGAKFKSFNGNFWSIGINYKSELYYLNDTSNSSKQIEMGPYFSFTIVSKQKLQFDLGLSTLIDSSFGGFVSYIGIYYGNKISIGFNLGAAHLDDYDIWKLNQFQGQRWCSFLVFTPRIKFRI